jgi:CBS domain-containing protein
MSLLRLIRSRPEVSPDTPVLDAVRTMTEGKVGAVTVLQGGKLVGIFTERDLMTRVVLTAKDPATARVGEVMTRPVHTVSDTASVAEAATMMRDHHIRHLPVVDDDGELLGVVALRYVLYDLMGRLETKVDDLETFIMTDGPGG